jgi:hypothetical protein
MNIKLHTRILAIVHLATGVLNFLILVLVTTIINSILPFIQEEIIAEEGANVAMIVEIAWGTIRIVIFFVLALISLPSIIGGIALLNEKKWGFILVLISGCLSLLSFPIGTAKGGYTLWVYIQHNNQDQNVKN